MKVLFIIIFCTLCNAAFGQVILTLKQLDSLKTEIRNYKNEDTLYVNLRIKYASHFFFHSPSDTSLINFLNSTLKISEKLNYKKGMMLSYINLGVVYSQQRSDPYTAIDYYHNALSIIEEDKKLNRYRSSICSNIGLIYYEQNDYKKAIKEYKQSIHYNYKSRYAGYSVLGNIYGSMNQPDSSIYYYKKAIDINRKSNNYIYLANDLSNMALILNGINKREEANQAIVEAISLMDQHQLDYGRGTAYLNAAIIYKDMGNVDLAEEYALKSLHIENGLDNFFVQKSIWGTLSEIYEEKEKYKESLDAYKKYYAYTDSISNEDRKSEITRKVMEYESEKKELESKAEIDKQQLIRNAVIIISSIVLFLGFFLFIGFRKRQKIKELQKELSMKARLSETELKALRAQMNPHFIFNSLNSISDYIHNNDPTSADYYLAKFAKLMRGILENSEEREISLTEEIKILELYMQLEAARLQNKFTYEIKIDPDVSPEIIMIPPLIIQPFVENSIWHGLSQKKEKGKIVIEISRENNLLNIKVEDDGIGRTNSESHKKSYGMKLTKERIQLHNAYNNAKANVYISDLQNGTRVEIKLPIIEEL